MASIYSVADHVVQSWFIAAEWLAVDDVVRLDSAACSKPLRQSLLSVLDQPGIEFNSFPRLHEYRCMQWAVKRNVRLRKVVLSGHFSGVKEFWEKLGAHVRTAEGMHEYVNLSIIGQFCSNLVEVSFTCDLSGPGQLEPLQHCKKLTKLSGTLIYGGAIKGLVQACSNLQTLCGDAEYHQRWLQYGTSAAIDRSVWTHTNVFSLRGLRQLQKLWLPGYNIEPISDALVMVVLSNLQLLRELCVGKISSESFIWLVQSSSALEIVECQLIDALLSATLHAVATGWKNLRDLTVWLDHLAFWKCADDFVGFIRSMPVLQCVCIDDHSWKPYTHKFPKGIKLAAMQVPVPAGCVSVVEVHVPSLPEAAIAELVSCSPRLTAFGHTQPVSAAVVQMLANTAVVSLSLSAESLVSQAPLPAMPKLQCLNVRKIRTYNNRTMTPALMAFLNNTPNLKILWLSFIDKADLRILLPIAKACPLLEEVWYRCVSEDYYREGFMCEGEWDRTILPERGVRALEVFMRTLCPRLRTLWA